MSEYSFPDEVIQAVSEAANLYPSDIAAAVAEAESAVRSLPCFSDAVEPQLVRNGIRGLIHDYRCNANREIKRGCSGGPSKVKWASSETVNMVASRYYDYFIGGKRLGDVLGSELLGIMSAESERARGHYANAKLCGSLMNLVKPDQTVREAVGAGQLEFIFKEAGVPESAK